MKRLLPLCGAFLSSLLLVFISCNVEEETGADDAARKHARDMELIQRLGYDIDDLFEGPEYYVVGGDILLVKDSLDIYFPLSDDPDSPQTRNYYRKDNVKVTQTNIKIGYDAQLDAGWATALNTAIAAWNAVVDCNLTFSNAGVTAEGTPDIWIQKGDQWSVPQLALTSTERPTGNNRPGRKIIVNRDYPQYNTAQREYNLIHAIGHAVGFMHSWDSGASKLNNVVAAEQTTFMYIGHNATTRWSKFSDTDLAAISTLYGSKNIENVALAVKYTPSDNANSLVEGKEYTFTATVTDAGGHYPNPTVNFTVRNNSGGESAKVTKVNNTSAKIVLPEEGEYTVTATISGSKPSVTHATRVTVISTTVKNTINWVLEKQEETTVTGHFESTHPVGQDITVTLDVDNILWPTVETFIIPKNGTVSNSATISREGFVDYTVKQSITADGTYTYLMGRLPEIVLVKIENAVTLIKGKKTLKNINGKDMVCMPLQIVAEYPVAKKLLFSSVESLPGDSDVLIIPEGSTESEIVYVPLYQQNEFAITVRWILTLESTNDKYYLYNYPFGFYFVLLSVPDLDIHDEWGFESGQHLMSLTEYEEYMMQLNEKYGNILEEWDKNTLNTYLNNIHQY